ncbi:serine hydrolase [Geminocystis sp. NIES-3709]|uniref:serine hydrolase n=1 Tax=Geminocystis sp. NIES-3709 TaxID=1617448 RepID=UPI0005FCCC10|nr:beta-lactamase [Geminocystis sp. NIES-3709]
MSLFLSRTHGENHYNRKSSPTKTKRKQPPSRKPSGVGTSSLNGRVIKTSNVVSPNQSITSENKSNDSLGNVILSNVFRLAIIGVGMGTIFGSILANIDLTKPLFPDVNLPFIDSLLTKITQNKLEVPTNTIESQRKNESEEKTNNNESLTFTQELGDLKNKFIQLKTKYPNLEPGAFFVDLDNGSFVNFNGTTTFSAASTIKIPILVAFFQDVDAGKIYLDEQLATSAKNIGSGSGGMQYQPIGTKYTAIHTATEMIINSDNTATNMIIERLGGKDELNKRFKEWGLDVTLINNSLPDLEGTNTTSPKDLAITLAKVNQGELISLRSRDRLLDIMRQTRTRTLLPQGIEKDATIAHKTGDIGTILGDAGIVDIPTGKRYIGGVLVKRPYNDYSARTLIQEISRTAYQHFKWYQPRPSLQTSSNASNTTSSN